jgi:plasmid stabilization system protein ParE
MAVKIVWSERAMNDIRQVHNYLHENWTARQRKKLNKETKRVLSNMINSPTTYPLMNKSVRKAFVSNIYSIYYAM